MKLSLSNLKNTLLIAAIALVSFAPANASDLDKALVKVPFPFTANHVAMPAGQYWVLSSDTSLALLDAKTRKAQAILLVRHETGGAIETQGRLTFRSSGGLWVLTDVQFAGSAVHDRMQVQPKQRKIETNRTPAVEIAMK
jgi:hypothetical protein